MFNRNSVSIVLIALFVLVGASSILAQQGNYSRVDVDSFIRNLENSSDNFSRDFQSAGRPTTSERRTVERFENAVDRLRRNFNSSDTWWNSRNDVQQMMGEARQVNVLMNNARFANRLEQQWRSLRRDINQLANTYNLPDLGGQGGGGGWNPGGGGGGNVPNWAVGTFYGRNPNTGGTITMSVSQNGSVMVNFGGISGGSTPTYATLNRTTLTVGNTRSRVSRLSNGIRTTRLDNGEVIDYFRDGSGGGGGGWNPGIPGVGGNVPNWAIGTFYGRNPQSGGRITLNIDTNGSVTIQFDNSSPSYATINGTMLNNQGTQSRVSQIRNGIRTTRTDNGEAIDYYRTPR